MAEQAYPPHLTAEQLSYLVTSFTDYSLSHGLVVRPVPSFVAQNPNNAIATTAPVTLWPSPFPKNLFTEARAIQTACNLLYARVASDESWLGELTTELSKVDDFIASLWAIHTRIKAESGYRHKYSLGLFRSDYMVHTEDGKPVGIRQVEFNTIASSFGTLSSKVSDLHRFLWRSGAYPPTNLINDISLPRNEALERLAEGLAKAHEVYMQDVAPEKKYKLEMSRTAGPTESFGIMFVVQEGERNAFDQRWLEYHITEKYGIRVFRISLPEIRKYTHHVRPNYELLFVPPHALSSQKQEVFEISVVYFRAGYGPDDYPTQEEWNTRYFLEESRAIKCPTVLTQLAGSKKVQQVLAGKANLEKFITDEQTKERVFDTFAAIYPMDTSEDGLRARKLAFEEPHRFVLKPQREGGGNNIYKEKIPEFLESIDEETWQGYILMELIHPPEVENIVMRNGQMMQGKVVGELGVYGTVIWKDGGDQGVKAVYNEEAGVLLRTKGSSSEEGGVAAGFGCIDSCVLVG
ncbi:hypothetical protein H072_4019 [Dactylellina haptotyla CBS 200.50]|uniref:Glutathione synthetase n=1 Tax=Dactylellina haptotyla (strain CBS 200.50) TaxID=1284197 RepID=S8ALK9_DACHA|nr:hypothetical protein H072_4019 [Dactylellina haptotyla CBS 200.50]